MELLCRLCSAKDYLMSLFNGKSIEGKTYLRKIIELILGIEIEDNDELSKWVCLNCAIRAFNFYKFKNLCTDNELILRENVKGKRMRTQSQSMPLSDILLPEEDQVYNVISHWLETKKNECSKKVSRKSTVGPLNFSITSLGGLMTVKKDIETQTDSLILEDKLTETEYLTEDGSMQTDNVKSEVMTSFTQTDIDNKNKAIQTEILSPEVPKLDTKSDSAYQSSDSELTPKTDECVVEWFDMDIDVVHDKSPEKSIEKLKVGTLCEFCGSLTPSMWHYRRHIKTHTMCQLCKKKFRKRIDNVKHECPKEIKILPKPIKIEENLEIYSKEDFILKPINRSKSMNDLFDINADYKTCKSLFFMKTLKKGTSKSTQTSFITKKDLLM